MEYIAEKSTYSETYQYIARGGRGNVDCSSAGRNAGSSVTYNKNNKQLKTYFNGQLFGKMTCLKIWNKELTDKEVADMDLFKEGVEVRKEYLYSNINLKSEAEVNKVGTFVGTGHTFK